jgi:hypothetical protein
MKLFRDRKLEFIHLVNCTGYVYCGTVILWQENHPCLWRSGSLSLSQL